MTGDLECLEQSIILEQEALELCPTNHPKRGDRLSSLGSSLFQRYQITEDLVSLEQSIAISQEALELCPSDHPDRGDRLRSLGISLNDWCEMTGDLSSLEKSIILKQEALNLCPPDHPDRGDRLSSLGSSLFQRCRKTGDFPSLEQSIILFQEALQLYPSGHPHHSRLMMSTALSYLQQFYSLHKPSSMEVSLSYMLTATMDTVSPPSVRLEAATHGLQVVQKCFNKYPRTLLVLIPDLLKLYKQAVTLVPRVASIGLEHHSRFSALRNSNTLGFSAATVALALAKTQEAIELLEETRTVFWSQALRTRTALDDLPPEDSSTLRELFSTLEAGAQEHDASKPAWSNPKVAHLRQTGKQAEDLIDSIRSRPGFERFLLNQPFDTLAQAAATGPVVVLLVYDSLCEAIIIPDPISPPLRVSLDEDLLKSAEELGKRVRAVNMRLRLVQQDVDDLHHDSEVADSHSLFPGSQVSFIVKIGLGPATNSRNSFHWMIQDLKGLSSIGGYQIWTMVPRFLLTFGIK